jgi:type I restriction enzyme R subunit
MLSNASYFAFTATPKNKTLEMFGVPVPQRDGEDAEASFKKYRPFHIYTMKQAIQEGFILDVLQNYTTIDSYYRIIKAVANDPQFDKDKAQKKLRSYVEGNEYTIEIKSERIVEHFLENIRVKIGGKARAMVVTASIERAIKYYYAISDCRIFRR